MNINTNFSTWEEIIAGVPQESIWWYYVDDNILYDFGSNMTEVKDKLSQDLLRLSEWFRESFMIQNPDKCHYMCLGRDVVNDILKFCDEELKSSELETDLGIEIYQKLTFTCHVKTLCSKAAKKTKRITKNC